MANPRILWNSRIPGATVTVTSEATGFEKANASDWLTFDWWKPTAAGTVYYTIDLGSALAVDSWGVAAHDLGTNSASIQLQYSTDNFAADTNDFAAAISPSTTEPRFQQAASQTKRYWRFKIVSASAASKIGVLMLGQMLELSEGLRIGHEPDALAQWYESKFNQSQGSALLGTSTYKKFIESSMRFTVLTPAFVRASWEPFLRHVETGKGFIYQPDPDNNPTEVIYGVLNKKFTPARYSHANFMEVNLPYVGIVN